MTTAKKITAPAVPRGATKPKAAKPATRKSPASKAPVKKSSARAPLSKSFAASEIEGIVPTQKVKKPKLIRDSFTIPKAEYLVFDELKQRSARLTRQAKKSELLRAGIKILATLSDAAFLTALAQVPSIKTGRPSENR